MSLTPSSMIDLGSPLPTFHLPDPEGNEVSSEEFAGKPLVVAFICNHCPFVKHIEHIADGFATFARVSDGGFMPGAIAGDIIDSVRRPSPINVSREAGRFHTASRPLYLIRMLANAEENTGRQSIGSGQIPVRRPRKAGKVNQGDRDKAPI